ncbi:MAG: helix-turn-helix transcriptional regulator, partial [Nevskia sp.]|nr:helix-turn-helix transcriptional regulator [Nevskia sp.]
REALGWDAAALARRLGYRSRTSIYQIEAGKQAVREEHAQWLAEVAAPLIQRPAPEGQRTSAPACPATSALTRAR